MLCKNNICLSALLMVLTKQMEESCTTKIWWVYGFLRFTFTFFVFVIVIFYQFLSGLFSLGLSQVYSRHNIYWSGYMGHSMWNHLTLPTKPPWILLKFCQVNLSIKKLKSWKCYHFLKCGSEIMTTWYMDFLAWIPNH